MGKLAIICLGMALSLPAFAQSAKNFDPALSTQVKPHPEGKGATKAAPAKSGEFNLTPSRLIGPTELEPYLKMVSSLFLIRNREHDPFGMVQNLDAIPTEKSSALGNTPAVAARPTIPFRDIASLIKVTSIMARDRKILLGSRAYKQGDLIPVQYQGKPLRVQITEVSSQQIVFQNLDTGETAIHSLGGLPLGMTPAGQRPAIPGMVPNGLGAPIELDADHSAP